MALLDPAIAMLCIEVCAAPVEAAKPPADAAPPPDLLEFIGEWGDDNGDVIDPTQLAKDLPPPKRTDADPAPPPAAAPSSGSGDADAPAPPR